MQLAGVEPATLGSVDRPDVHTTSRTDKQLHAALGPAAVKTTVALGETGSTTSTSTSSFEPGVVYIVNVWPWLPIPVRARILGIIEAALLTGGVGTPPDRECDRHADPAGDTGGRGDERR